MKIPTHQSNKTQRHEIVVNHLALLNEYDFTEPHRHQYIEFFYFIKGGGSHKIDFIDFPIVENSVHIVAPGQVHQMARELDSEGYVILFELPAIQAHNSIENFLFEHVCMDASELEPAYRFDEEDAKSWKQRVEHIFRLYQSDSELDQLALRNEIQAFCIGCMKKKSNTSTAKDSNYLKFRRILKDHFRDLKKVKEYAERMSISEKSLNDLVKKHTGKPASTVIYNQIIMEAKRLLHTRLSIKETAYELNFNDPAHFSKFFKAQTGISPSDFQNNA